MTTDEIKILSTTEKMKIMQAIWEDMRDHFESAGVAPEVAALLRQRRERVLSGQAKLLDWDTVKFAIGRG